MIKIMNESIEDDFTEFDLGNNDEGWYAEAPKECIKGATLLSIEEYKKYKDDIPDINRSWWLKSTGYYIFSACYVKSSGNIDDYRVDCTFCGIRPALILNLQSFNFEIGDKLEFGEHLFTILSNKLAICDDIIGKGCFRKNIEAEGANDYEKSDVKKYVKSWFRTAYAEYEG